MGLFSGGGVLGDVGEHLGINSGRAEDAIRQQSADALEIQERNRAFELEDRAAFEEDKKRGLQDLHLGRFGAEQSIRTGRRESEDVLRGGQADSIASLLFGGLTARGDIGAGTTGAIDAFGPAAEGLQFGPQVAQSSTLEGFGQNISDILSGGSLDPLIGQRQEAATSALTSAGLSRSNVAAERAAEIPADLAFGLESQLFGRAEDRFQTGLGAQSEIARLLETQGINLANLDIGVSQGVSGLQEGGAANIADLISGEKTNLANLSRGSSKDIANLRTRQPGQISPFEQTSDPIAIAQVKAQRDKNIQATAKAIADAIIGGKTGGFSSMFGGGGGGGSGGGGTGGSGGAGFGIFPQRTG